MVSLFLRIGACSVGFQEVGTLQTKAQKQNTTFETDLLPVTLLTYLSGAFMMCLPCLSCVPAAPPRLRIPQKERVRLFLKIADR